MTEGEEAARTKPGRHVRRLTETPPDGEYVRSIHRRQMHVAERFVVEHQETLRYGHGLGWMAWDGWRWKRDADAQAERCVHDTLRSGLEEVAKLPTDEEPLKTWRAQLLADLRGCETANAINGVLAIARTMKPISQPAEAFDSDPYLFNTRNGTFDLRLRGSRPADKADLITKVAGAIDPEFHLRWGEDASPPARFLQFLEEILPDAEMRAFVQRLIGSAMLGLVRDHVLPIFYGTGANGKGTFINIMRAAFGDYAIEVERDLLIERGPAHPTGKADLRGIRLATTSETDKGMRLAAATVKALTGGDTIRARFMRGDFFEFKPSHLIIMATNHKPELDGGDDAIMRRAMPVPFDVVIPPEARDTKLSERLEEELPGILGWAIEGYRAYADTGLRPPERVTKAIEEYRVESDDLGRFLAERTVPSPRSRVKSSLLFEAWRDWCFQEGISPGTRTAFGVDLARRSGIRKSRKTSERAFIGIKIRDV